eukprot:4709620-Amphidinium_carterae.2
MDLLIDGSMIDADVLSYRGAGVVLDAELGLVLTDRTTIPQSLGLPLASKVGSYIVVSALGSVFG